MDIFILAVISAALSGNTAVGQINDDSRTLVDAVISSTNREWSTTFAVQGRRYDTPRVVFLQPPRHHPSRGFGYARNFGVFVDLGEIADIEIEFKDDADALIALIIAHEVAHHVHISISNTVALLRPLGQRSSWKLTVHRAGGSAAPMREISRPPDNRSIRFPILTANCRATCRRSICSRGA